MNIESLMAFIKEADRLKQVQRQALIHNGGRRENSAEHSWHLALTVLVMQGFAPEGTDMNKAIRMALLHDLVEIDAGDTFVYGNLAGKEEAELKAIDRLTALLPVDVASDLKSLWLEFEKGEGKEARFVSAIDRFLPIYSNYLNEGYSWKNHGVRLDQIVAKCEAPISQGIPALWTLTEKMLQESVDKGDLAR